MREDARILSYWKGRERWRMCWLRKEVWVERYVGGFSRLGVAWFTWILVGILRGSWGQATSEVPVVRIAD